MSKLFQVFDVWADFACFKKNYATSSPQTFAFPPPSTVMGMCACIIGEKWGTFVNKYLSEIELGIEPRFSEHHGFSKVRMGMKLIITKDVWNENVYAGKKPFVSSPVTFELLYKPSYRIYIHSESVREKLHTMLRAHKSHLDTC